MNILQYVFSKSYRKHRWAVRHLAFFRRFLIALRTRQIMKRPPVFPTIVERQYQDNMNKAMGKLIEVPKFKEVSAKELCQP